MESVSHKWLKTSDAQEKLTRAAKGRLFDARALPMASEPHLVLRAFTFYAPPALVALSSRSVQGCIKAVPQAVNRL